MSNPLYAEFHLEGRHFILGALVIAVKQVDPCGLDLQQSLQPLRSTVTRMLIAELEAKGHLVQFPSCRSKA